MSQARISKAAQRSRLTKGSSDRSGPNGFHHNPGDFSERVGSKFASRQMIMKENWHYLPEWMRRKADKLSTSFKGVAVDTKSGQFELGI